MAPKNPTNTDILKEIREINKKLEVYGTDISELKNWKIAVEAAKQALKDYQSGQNNSSNGSGAILKALIAVTAVIAILAGVILILAKT